MESQQQPLKYAEPSSLEARSTAEQASLPELELPPAIEFNQQLQQVGTQVSTFLVRLPDYIGRWFNDYRQPTLIFALIAISLITLRVVLIIIDALKDIPLVTPTIELIGIGYLVWFTNRYLIMAPNRQELSKVLQSIKKRVVGSQQPSKS